MLEKYEITVPGEKAGACVIYQRKLKNGFGFYLKRRLPMNKRINPRNPYHVVSLGTDNFEIAKAEGYRKLFEIDAKISTGQGLHGHEFRKTAEGWYKQQLRLASLEGYEDVPSVKASALKRHRSVLNRYLLPFFGSLKTANIQQSDCQRYVNWRIQYYVDGPGKDEHKIEFVKNGKTHSRPAHRTIQPSHSTLIKDAATFNAVLKYAEEELGIKFSILPKLKFKKSDGKPTGRRERFANNEMKQMLTGLSERCNPDSAKTFNTFHYRCVLVCLVQFLYLTGIRPNEAMWLKKKHLIGKADKLRIFIARDNPALKSPTHARVVIPKRNLEEIMQSLFCHYDEVWSHNFPQSTPDRLKSGSTDFDYRSLIPDDQWLFSKLDKSRISSMRKSFGAAIDVLDLRGDKSLMRSLYSLRHTYASEMIEDGATAKGLWMLCRNMGTSPAMLHAHYGQALHEVDAEMFLGAELEPEDDWDAYE